MPGLIGRGRGWPCLTLASRSTSPISAVGLLPRPTTLMAWQRLAPAVVGDVEPGAELDHAEASSAASPMACSALGTSGTEAARSTLTRRQVLVLLRGRHEGDLDPVPQACAWLPSSWALYVVLPDARTCRRAGASPAAPRRTVMVLSMLVGDHRAGGRCVGGRAVARWPWLLGLPCGRRPRGPGRSGARSRRAARSRRIVWMRAMSRRCLRTRPRSTFSSLWPWKRCSKISSCRRLTSCRRSLSSRRRMSRDLISAPSGSRTCT